MAKAIKYFLGITAVAAIAFIVKVCLNSRSSKSELDV